MTQIWGTSPEAAQVRLKIRPYWRRAPTPSWILAPPESIRPIIGMRRRRASSRRRTILSPSTAPRAPPEMEKSWE